MRKIRKDGKIKNPKHNNPTERKHKKPILSRRDAFKQMCGEVLVSYDEIRGHKHCALSGLETIEREKFEGLIPFINKEFELALEEDWLVEKP